MKEIRWNEEQLKLVEKYAGNGMQLLKNICLPIIKSKNTLQMDYDDLLSDGLKVLCESVTSYDPTKGAKFETFLIGNIKKSYSEWRRDQMRQKRCNYLTDKHGNVMCDEDGEKIIIQNISLDDTTNDSNFSISEVIPDANIEVETLSDNVEKYLESLTDLERKIANYIMQGYTFSEIRKILHIDADKFSVIIKGMGSFDKSCIVYESNCKGEIDMTNENKMDVLTREKCKKEMINLMSLYKKWQNKTILYNHPLQRESDQWTRSQIGNLVSDMLQGNPIAPIYLAEQVKDGRNLVWCIDGKQRSSNAFDFMSNKIKISKLVRRYNIDYVANVKDEDGNIVEDEFGVPVTEVRTFDIRNKYFKDLPEELQDKFKDFTFDYVMYLNCTDEDIAYHIERCNDGKPMNGKQKGLIRLGEHFAAKVKGLANTECFKNRCNLSKNANTNGDGHRAVVESIVTTSFLDDWNKEFGKMCDFLKNNATTETFDDFDDLVEHLTSTIGDRQEVWDMFTQKDVAIWFGVFGRFVNLGESDKKFVEFMAEFSQSLHTKEVDGVTWDELNESRNTKDKATVMDKINHIMSLLHDFCGTEEHEEIDDLTFVQTMINDDATEDDIEEYNDYLDTVLPMDCNIAKNCHQALLAIVAYAYLRDEDDQLSDWLAKYRLITENSTFSKNQKENYNMMMHEFAMAA